MAISKFYFDDLCISPNIASALEGYATIRKGDDWTIDQIYLRHINGNMHPAEDTRLFSLVEEALERDFAREITAQCGASLDDNNRLTTQMAGVGRAA